ncbi:cupin domain-containing protein [Desulfocurvus sp. DL9XJH121]
MHAGKAQDIPGAAVKGAPYKGEILPATGVTIRWLSKAGADDAGNPEYGLRHFTVEPGGVIPMHHHAYLQTMYIESGSFECFVYDPETDKVLESRICGPGDYVYSPCMEPHGMRNASDTEPGTFLCCIGCVDQG